MFSFLFYLVGLFVPSELLAATSNANRGHPEMGFCCDMQIPILFKGTFQERERQLPGQAWKDGESFPVLGGFN